jgi:hypothetical protein
MVNTHQLGRWLMREIHGVDVPRKPPRRASAITGAVKPARDWRYRAWIRSLPSAVSGRTPCDAAHTGRDGGMSVKPSDYSCIPLTREEHVEYHAIGRRAFEAKHALDIDALVHRLNADWWRARRMPA